VTEGAGQFSRVPIWAAGVKELSLYDVRVLIAIGAHADKVGNAHPGLSRIASVAQIDRRNVSRSIARLVKAGVIRHQAKKSGSAYTIVYDLGATVKGNGEYHEPAKETIEQGATPKNAAVPEEMLAIWKEECGDVLAVPVKLNRDRINSCLARFKDSFKQDLEQWRALCREISASNFCCGSRGWKADFDWALKPKSILGLLEGKYRDNAPLRRRAASNGPVGF